MPERLQCQGDHRGFTLIEALVVLAIVGFTAAIAYPQLDRSLSGFQARKARGELVAGVLDARSTAIRMDRPVALTVDRGGTSFSVNGAGSRTLSGLARIDGRPGPLWFYPDGSASGGQLTLVTVLGTTTFVVSRDLGTISTTSGQVGGQVGGQVNGQAAAPGSPDDGPGSHA